MPSWQARPHRSETSRSLSNPMGFFPLVLLLCCLVTIAPAADFYPNVVSDLPDAIPGDGLAEASDNSRTLRAAIMEANALPGPDTIHLFHTPGSPFVLSLGPADSSIGDLTDGSGDLDVSDDLIIMGGGATIDAQGLDRLFQMESATSVPLTVRLEDLTLSLIHI